MVSAVAVAGQLKSVVSINGVLEVVSCVGFIHSQKWVVTAAHCIAEYEISIKSFLNFLTSDNNYFLFILTMNSLNLDPSLFIVTTRSDIAYPVKSIKRHPNYQSLSKFNDIALVELEIPIPFTSDVGPVNYPSVDPPAATIVQQLSEFDPIILSNPTIISNSDCVQKWGFLLGPDVTDKNICIDADGDQDGLDVCINIHYFACCLIII